MREPDHPTGPELQAFFHNELSPEDADRVTEHCKDCVLCRSAISEMEEIHGILNRVPEPELPRSVWYRIAETRRRNELPLGRTFKLAMTAACTAGIIMGLLFGPVRFSPDVLTEGRTEGQLSSVWGGESSTSLLSVYTMDEK